MQFTQIQRIENKAKPHPSPDPLTLQGPQTSLAESPGDKAGPVATLKPIP